MSLPESRDYDAVDAGPLPHTTVNNIQDSIIGAKHGLITKNVPMHEGTILNGFTLSQAVGFLSGGAANEQVSFPIDLPVGSRITQVRVAVNQVGVTPMNFDLLSLSQTGVFAVEYAEAGDATTGNKLITNATEVVIASFKSYWIIVESHSQLGDNVRFPELTYKKP